MTDKNKEGLDLLVTDIEQMIERTSSRGLTTTTLLLRIARLDLITNIHEIEDDELKAFSDFILSRVEAA